MAQSWSWEVTVRVVVGTLWSSITAVATISLQVSSVSAGIGQTSSSSPKIYLVSKTHPPEGLKYGFEICAAWRAAAVVILDSLLLEWVLMVTQFHIHRKLSGHFCAISSICEYTQKPRDNFQQQMDEYKDFVSILAHNLSQLKCQSIWNAQLLVRPAQGLIFHLQVPVKACFKLCKNIYSAVISILFSMIFPHEKGNKSKARTSTLTSLLRSSRSDRKPCSKSSLHQDQETSAVADTVWVVLLMQTLHLYCQGFEVILPRPPPPNWQDWFLRLYDIWDPVGLNQFLLDSLQVEIQSHGADC